MRRERRDYIGSISFLTMGHPTRITLGTVFNMVNKTLDSLVQDG
jgi:hypothetical protein